MNRMAEKTSPKKKQEWDYECFDDWLFVGDEISSIQFEVTEIENEDKENKIYQITYRFHFIN